MFRRAFTLLEVLIVILLLALMAAFVWPEFGPSERREHLDESTRRIKAAVAMCRAQAMNESRRYVLILGLDGQIYLGRQLDPLKAPHQYERIRDSWAQIALVFDDAWIESVLPLPEGPPPILVEDDTIEFENTDEELVMLALEDLEFPVRIEFAPDGSSSSARWVLRDSMGRGIQMTLDGRLGHVETLDVPALDAAQVVVPKRNPAPPDFVEEEA